MTNMTNEPDPLPRWIYDSPDSGTEMSVNHPHRSGECPDAENVRRATKANLAAELLLAWVGWAEERWRAAHDE